MSLLELKKVSLQIEGNPILDNLSMKIWENHVHAIIGSNGAGKSTIANTVMGLSGYRDFEGDILFEGKSIKNLGVTKRAQLGITLLFQEPARFEGLGVKDFILAGSKEKKSQIAIEALQKVGLDPLKYMQRAVDKTLSGGERKRIELASIYTMKPQLVLMDEPDSGVDIDSLRYIFDVIQDLRAMGSTVVLITHSGEVLKHADHAFLICSGKLVDKGDMKEMYNYFNGVCVPCKHVGNPKVKPENQTNNPTLEIREV